MSVAPKLARQRRMLPRHLSALGLPHDIVAHRDQNCAHIVVRRRHVFDQRACKRRVSSCPIEGYVSRLGREADEGADPGFSRRKASPDVCGTRAHGAREIACKRIIPAGVDEQDVGRRLALHGPLHEIEAHHLEIQRRWSLQLSIDRYDVVLPRNLKAMSGVEKQPNLGAIKRRGEIADFSFQGRLVQIESFR
jgi:hypothetical protein